MIRLRYQILRLSACASGLLLVGCGSDTTVIENTSCRTTQLDSCVEIECPGSEPVQVCDGSDGSQGPQGNDGTPGGPPGPRGAPGEDGASCTVETVSSAEARIICDDGTEALITAPGRPRVTSFGINVFEESDGWVEIDAWMELADGTYQDGSGRAKGATVFIQNANTGELRSIGVPGRDPDENGFSRGFFTTLYYPPGNFGWPPGDWVVDSIGLSGEAPDYFAYIIGAGELYDTPTQGPFLQSIPAEWTIWPERCEPLGPGQPCYSTERPN